MASNTGSSSRHIARAATAAVLSFALLLPANAQFWGNSWGGRPEPTPPAVQSLCAAALQSLCAAAVQSLWEPMGLRGLSSATKVLLPPPAGTAQRSPEGTAQRSREGAAPGLLA